MNDIYLKEYVEWDEEEWYSVCCTAPPLYDLHTESDRDPAGLCMQCRDLATFELKKENHEE